jgi:hypothetical protein
MLLFVTSVLLKIIPELGSAGLKQRFTTLPLCKPTPEKFTIELIVF